MSDVFGSTKGFCRFPVSRHFKAPLSVFKRFCCFSCLQTHSKVCRSPASVSDGFGPTKGFCRFPVSRHLKAPLSVFKRFCCFSCLQTHSVFKGISFHPIEIQRGCRREILFIDPIEIQRGCRREILFIDSQIQSPKSGNNFSLPLNLDADTPHQRHAHLQHQHLDHSRQRVFKLSVQRLSFS